LRCERDAAAFLAGAEALERQERDLDAIKAADAALTEATETISDLRGNLEVAKAALRGLVAALDQVHEDPYYQRVWNVHQLYCGPYKGKKYEAELKQATAALARL
jgi:hypothetical protein